MTDLQTDIPLECQILEIRATALHNRAQEVHAEIERIRQENPGRLKDFQKCLAEVQELVYQKHASKDSLSASLPRPTYRTVAYFPESCSSIVVPIELEEPVEEGK